MGRREAVPMVFLILAMLGHGATLCGLFFLKEKMGFTWVGMEAFERRYGQ
jgi:hypothetical protein